MCFYVGFWCWVAVILCRVFTRIFYFADECLSKVLLIFEILRTRACFDDCILQDGMFYACLYESLQPRVLMFFSENVKMFWFRTNGANGMMKVFEYIYRYTCKCIC